jgi:hypothetical protein
MRPFQHGRVPELYAVQPFDEESGLSAQACEDLRFGKDWRKRGAFVDVTFQEGDDEELAQ